MISCIGLSMEAVISSETWQNTLVSIVYPRRLENGTDKDFSVQRGLVTSFKQPLNYNNNSVKEIETVLWHAYNKSHDKQTTGPYIWVMP